MLNSPYNPVLLYVTDPMCAWCYGFTQVIRRLRALWHGRLSVEVIAGGLHPYATEPIAREYKERLAVSWHRVQERTSLPFNYSLFLNESYVYNTEPACRALHVVRRLRPALTLEVLRALHSAFYADGLNLADPAVLASVIRPFGINESLFYTLFEADEIIEETEKEFEFVEMLGVTDLPSVYIEGGMGPELLVRGFCQLDELEERLLQHLEMV
ncbi:DsbA family protein [Pontibacter sp. JH31]|uniref:DsbA family protein n=1 Tax=Pontibacter aquaedesilientis TaxID=2766980 RepID=A0ABR7XB34_9BACT|nr:DsbA family protein [Pontibacter aquaedesilientis]MBD1395545.1 DsbA family protein [Pontibacter aquaedesilientis]